MARKKKSKVEKVKVQKTRKTQTVVRSSRVNFQDSYVSLVLGVLVVIIAATILFSFLIARRSHPFANLENMRANLQQQLNTQSAKPTPKPTPMAMETTYTIVSGDSLWNIAVAKYNDGTKWTQIAAANHILNPGVLYAGAKLSLPDKFETKNYTVKNGDSLWTIAVNNYGDGYRWIDIARENNLTNPNWISSGQVLILPQ